MLNIGYEPEVGKPFLVKEEFVDRPLSARGKSDHNLNISTETDKKVQQILLDEKDAPAENAEA